MNIERIDRRIERAVMHERATNAARRAVRRFFSSIGRPITTDQAQRTIGWITDYVRHVPLILRGADEEAGRREARVFDEILDVACSFWHVGAAARRSAVGLMSVTDDAYCSLSLLQRVSQRLYDEAGTPFVDLDLDAANEMMRKLIGEPFATRLDRFVTQGIGAVTGGRMFAAVASTLRQTGPVMTKDRDPIWSEASSSEIAAFQAGALGVA